MAWHPSTEERKYIELIVSMSVDCLMNKGTVDAMTYVANLKIAANSIQEIANKSLNHADFTVTWR